MGSTRCFPYCCAHFGIPIGVVIGGLCLVSRLFWENVQAYDSAEFNLPWNYTKPPFYSALIADLHHTQIQPGRTVLLQAQLANITQKFNPPFIALAGDLVDSLNETLSISFYRQYEENWILYNGTRVFSSLFDDNRSTTEIAGNHDMMAVAIDNSIINRYRNYTMKPGEAFGVRWLDFQDQFSVPVRLISYNPLKAPFTSRPMGIFPCHNITDVEELDNAITNDDPGQSHVTNIIITHFPMNHIWSVGSTTETFRGVREVVRRADMYLAGHLHPAINEITRKDNTTAVVVTAFFQSPQFIVAFADNGGAAVQVVDTHDENVVVVTYPIHKNQLNGRHVFNTGTFPVRVISFSESPLYLTVYIDDVFMGSMAYLGQLRRNNHFYTLNVSRIPPGDHKLRVGHYEMTFFVGSRTASTTEYANILYCPDTCIFGCFGLFLHILFHVIPWWGTMEEALENFGHWMYGEPTTTPLAWYQVIVLGPLYQIARLRKAPFALYIYCWVLGTMFLFFHMYCMYDSYPELPDAPAYLATAYIWGVKWPPELDNQVTRYAMLAALILLYETLFVSPAIYFIGFWFERPATIPWDCGQWVSAGILVLAVIVAYVAWGVFAYVAGGWYTVLTSPVMMVMTLTFLVLAFGLWNFTKREHTEWRSRERSPADVQSVPVPAL
jgi:hypothetical protein